MKNKVKKTVLVSFAMIMLLGNSAYARDYELYQEAKNEVVDSALLPETKTESRSTDTNIVRSQHLAGATSEITNAGGGSIGIFAQTRMHVPVDWAYLTVYLERWYEDSKSWQVEETFEKEFWPEDDEDGKLTAATFSTKVTDQPAGNYYRVRAIHELECGDNYEVKVTRTDGIMITSTP